MTIQVTKPQEVRDYLSRIENLEEEKKEVSEQIKELYTEFKAKGHDADAMRKLVAERKKDPRKVEDLNAILDVYRELAS